MKNSDFRNVGVTANVAGVDVVLDLSGALFIPDSKILVVADLHFEKASSFARRGRFLPPYDTSITLAALESVTNFYAPKTVVCLGDSFHDPFAAERLQPDAIARFDLLATGRQWIWITGNHDPQIPHMLAGECVEELCLGPLTLRHIPELGEAGRGEIAGHLHPVARIVRRERAVRRPCFACDGSRLIMPAFGAMTGGLALSNPAFRGLFGEASLVAYLIGADRLYAVPSQGLC
jgi:DNA ligase-associated metallophosphoesterase